MGSYTIRSGDTLSSIASRFHTSVGALQQLNGIANPNVIYAGRSIRVPDSYTAPTPKPVNLGGGSKSGWTSYTVRPGDSLSGIAAKFGTTVSAIASANGIANPNLIYAGRTLHIPTHGGTPVTPTPPAPSGGARYTVRAGDTLSGIAARYGSSVSAIAQANHIANPNLISVGQVLTIPGGHSTGPVGPVTPTPPGPTTGGVSVAQLQRIMPGLSTARANECLPWLNQAMAEAHINTPKRQAAFLAQLAHESGQFKWFEELASGAAYEGRADLGNTHPGDGVRYKGRGPIQLTGRANYQRAGDALGLDLINHPEIVATPSVGFRVAAWFWSTHNLNAKADAGDFDGITRSINGGYNGKASRDEYYRRALAALNA